MRNPIALGDLDALDVVAALAALLLSAVVFVGLGWVDSDHSDDRALAMVITSAVTVGAVQLKRTLVSSLPSKPKPANATKPRSGVSITCLLVGPCLIALGAVLLGVIVKTWSSSDASGSDKAVAVGITLGTLLSGVALVVVGVRAGPKR